MKVRVLVVDDHKMFRQAVVRKLAKYPDIEVVAEGGDGMEALAKAREFRPDVVCMDVNMPKLNGIKATRRLIAAQPEIKVIALTSHAHAEYVVEMLNAGALAYVIKEDVGDELLHAIHAVQQQKIYLAPNAAKVLADILRIDKFAPSASASRLDAFEQKLMWLLGKNSRVDQIAAQTRLNPSVVRACLRSIMRKLDLRSIAELMAYAARVGH